MRGLIILLLLTACTVSYSTYCTDDPTILASNKTNMIKIDPRLIPGETHKYCAWMPNIPK